MGSNTAYLAEAAAPERRGAVVSWQLASQVIALIVGSLVGVALTAILPPALLDAYGWRVALLLGAAAVPFGLWLRFGLPETLGVAEPEGSRAAEQEPDTPPAGARSPHARPGAHLTCRHWRIMVLGLVALGGGTIGSYIFTYIVTYAQHTLHLSARIGFLAEFANYAVSLPVCVLGGRLSDRLGRWPVTVWSNLAFLVAIYPVFAWIVAAPSAGLLTAGMALLGAVSAIVPGAFLAALAEALPQAVRSTGFGTIYALAIAIFGGTTQLVVTWLIHVSGSAIAPAWYLIGATAVAQIALMLFPETAPVRLPARAAAAA